MSLLQNSNAIQTAAGAYNINNSLRLRNNANATLSRTPSTAGNRSTWTWSAWIKRGRLTPSNGLGLFGSGTINSGTNETSIRFTANDELGFMNYRVTTKLFRDIAAWYHIVVAFDTTQATANNRVRMYVNGVEETSFSTLANPTLNSTAEFINSTTTHYMGVSFATTSLYDDRYQAEVHFVDGQQLTASSFGETDTTTGVWKPKAYTGTYGTNGFYQKYSDPSEFPILVNKTVTSQSNTAQATITVNVPSGVNNGDLLILVVNGGNSTVYTTPAGWTLWFPTTNVTAIYYRVASSEPASYTVTGSVNTTAQGFMLAYRNATVDVMGTLTGGSGSNPIVAPAITTTANNTIVIAYFRNNTASDTFSTPSGYTALVSETTSPDPSGAIFTKTQATAGSTGTVSSTPTTTNGRGILFSIKPISTTNLGLDSSGNGNHWTTNNISVAAGETYDAMVDSPTNTSETVANYPTLNRLALPLRAYPDINSGNLIADNNNTNSNQRSTATMAMPPGTGKYYWETVWTGAVSIGVNTGILNAELLTNQSVNNNGYTMSSNAGAVIGLTYDCATGILTGYLNNVSQGTKYTADTTKTWFPCFSNSNTASLVGVSVNFGQRPFTYTPPAGFKALNSFNLADDTILKGNNYMDATLYTGTGASLSVTNAAGFRPDLVWIKGRSIVVDNDLFDSVRGVNLFLVSNTDVVEGNNPNTLTAFNSNGFNLGTSAFTNSSGATFVAWQWQAGSSTVTNTSGTISAQVRANTTAGFSIVTYTGTGANATVGHGLGIAPDMMIIKRRNTSASGWVVYHKNLTAPANTSVIPLNSTNAVTTAQPSVWNSTSPTSTVFSLGSSPSVNASGGTYVAYCWDAIPGFSSFGDYVGSGNTNGVLIYTGFSPKFIIIKNITTSGTSWKIVDSSRSPRNIAAQDLEANSTNAEVTGTSTTNLFIDLLSNGFKLRGTAASLNTNGNIYIYAAFAENPFKNSLAR